MAPSGIDLLVSFDTTGSMYPCLSQVRENIECLVKRLFTEIPDLRISIMAHGDYCDRGKTYVTKMLDFTANLHDVVQFVRKVGRTHGGDYPECYELVLHEARGASWSARRARVAVLIADAFPHEGGRENESGYDWRNEARMLKEAGIQVYAVQCLNVAESTYFYRELASLTDGLHLRLNQFRHVENLLLGIAYKLDSPDRFQRFENEVRGQRGYTRQVESMFDTLAGRATKTYGARADGLVPVDPARFQVFEVGDDEPSIRDFVESRGITFKKGRGFYPHITRPELIQENKEVILEDLSTGEMFTGAEAREMIGLPFGRRGTVRPNPVPGHLCWVQSTSVNRKLRERAFMYEVPEEDRRASC